MVLHLKEIPKNIKLCEDLNMYFKIEEKLLTAGRLGVAVDFHGNHADGNGFSADADLALIPGVLEHLVGRERPAGLIWGNYSYVDYTHE